MSGELGELFKRLGRSKFHSRFRLRGREIEHLGCKGLKVLLEHAADFVGRRLAPAHPANDGKQTPTGHHPTSESTRLSSTRSLTVRARPDAFLRLGDEYKAVRGIAARAGAELDRTGKGGR
jgi:hypothetical protein